MHKIQVFWFSVYSLLFYVILFNCEWVRWCVVSKYFVSSFHFPECVWNLNANYSRFFSFRFVSFPILCVVVFPKRIFHSWTNHSLPFFTFLFPMGFHSFGKNSLYCAVSVRRYWLNCFWCATYRFCYCCCCNYFTLFRSKLRKTNSIVEFNQFKCAEKFTVDSCKSKYKKNYI